MRDYDPAVSTAAIGGYRDDARPEAIERGLVAGLLALVVATPPIGAQEPDPAGIEVKGVGPLVAEAVPFRQVETYLAVNPTDSTNMIATALANSEDGGLAYVTHDGGDTWRRIDGPGDPVFPGGDPMVDFGADGRAYLSTLASGFSVWRSSDGGRSWSGPAEVGGTLDRQWVVAPNSGTDGRRPVYAAVRAGRGPGAAIAVFVSDDGGRTFRETARMTPETGVLNGVNDLEVTSDSTLILPYLAFTMQSRGEEVGRGRQRVLRSRDGGDTWSGPHRAPDRAMFTNAADQDLMYRGLGKGGVAVGEAGGEFDGTVYMTWSHVVDGFLQPMLARSHDGGRSWSSPVRVNRGGKDSHHSTPQVAAGPGEVVAVTWNDRRHDPDGRCYHHYVAISRDGGRTFGDRRRVSERETCLPSGYRWQNGGDTQGLVALPDGSFRTVWSGPGPHGPRPWTAEIRIR